MTQQGKEKKRRRKRWVEFMVKSYRGMLYIVGGTRYGYRCGYVYMIQEPVWWKGYHFTSYIACHGGLTFEERYGGSCSESLFAFEVDGEKHPKEGSILLGFDCAHTGDRRDPELLRKAGTHDDTMAAYGHNKGVIRDVVFCQKECQAIIDQLWAGPEGDTLAGVLRETKELTKKKEKV